MSKCAPQNRGVTTPPVYGMCTACWSVATGTRDLSDEGESDTYPTGYGCEVCA